MRRQEVSDQLAKDQQVKDRPELRVTHQSVHLDQLIRRQLIMVDQGQAVVAWAVAVVHQDQQEPEVEANLL